MPYEEIQGEVVTMSENSDVGFSGQSTDWPGAQQAFVKVYWTSTGGITNSGNWADFNSNNYSTFPANICKQCLYKLGL